MSEQPTAAASHRVDKARRRVALAAAAAKQARAAAAPALEARAERRRGRLWLMVFGSALVALVLVVLTVVLLVAHHGAEADRDRDQTVLADTRSAVEAMLTIDPSAPEEFVEQAIAVTSGEQRRRLEDSREQLVEVIGELRVPSTGQVLSAGIVGEVAGGSAQVLVVAEGTNPTVLGADPSQSRVALLVTMKDSVDHWTIDRTEIQ
ncbi:hypothetical protein [Williamsia sp.]|uniref:hypothetical protein n=1 Tax=Williamsia sp. TaxID=1872085 RepID=UPI002F943ACA